MKQTDKKQRMQAKTPEQRLMNVLTQEFNYAPKIAQAIVVEAQARLLGQEQHLRPGQVRVILVKREAAPGQALTTSETIEVTWTVDAGVEDDEIEQRAGSSTVRRSRIQRLVDEAIRQGAVASQEDLTQVLHVSVRTIKWDCAYLQQQGMTVLTRGKVKGIGRGQSHKAQIVGRWLRGETYDQIAQCPHHSLGCVKRYVQAFVRVVKLHQKGLSTGEISLLVQSSPALVEDYLTIYHQNETPFNRLAVTRTIRAS